MTKGATFRGQPLVLLGVLLAGWIGMRVAIWEPPVFHRGNGQSVCPGEPGLPALSEQEIGGSPESQAEGQPDTATGAPPSDTQEWWRRPVPEALPARPGWDRLVPRPLPPAVERPDFSDDGASQVSQHGATIGPAVGHNLLMMAGLQGELPDALVAALQREPTPPSGLARHSAEVQMAEAAPAPAGAVRTGAVQRGSRWSADAWLLLREDKDVPLLVERGAYGRSQAGAVLRYSLAPGSGHRPQAHLRGSAALSSPGAGQHDKEVAVGLSARPIPSVPVRVAAEARVSEMATGTSVRPAVYAVSEVNPVALPLGTRGEVYLQAGYVGGDFVTAFVDGQARVDRTVGGAGPAEFFVGAAAWGGAQKGASRLDVGPSAGATIGIGKVRGRLSADYRFRVAGDSLPTSGPALTLSAGF